MAFSFKQTISFLYVIVVLASTSSSLRHDEECLALFQFKQSILHQPSASFDHKFDSWRKIPSNASDHDHDDSNSDCCFWDGVLCSKKGHVIGLDLSQSSLIGPIKSNNTLFKLIHLQMLNLSMNDFVESQIPSEIARLKQLRILDLSDSGFGGHIPSEISQLVQLSSLDLSSNSLNLRSPSLEYLLQNMIRLEELNLAKVNVSSSVPRFLANFSSLRLINLGSCQLQDEFPSAIFHLPKLRYLHLRNNTNLAGFLPEFHNNTILEYLQLYMTGIGGIIPESIGKLNHLVFLELSHCSFSGRIPVSLSNLTQLTTLSLGENALTGQIPSLESLSKLDILDLSFNDFEKGRLLDQVSKLTKLNELYLYNMNIYDEIPSTIANLTNLSVAEIGRNFIFGQIPPSLLNLTTLTALDLSHNQLHGPISNAFANLKRLVYLSLENNTFNGTVDLDTFTLAGFKKLEELVLGYNRMSLVATNNYTNNSLPELKVLDLTSCNLKEFPAFLRNQNKMFLIDLSYNKIEGLIPTWILNNSQETLQLIDLRNNLITGFHQHPHFLPWLDLKVFNMQNNRLQGRLPIPPRTTIVYDVSYNNLTGEIPPLICEAKSLQFLGLSSNHMLGTLPPCFGNLSKSLIVLNLNRNNFYGPMMNTFTYGSPLKEINLSENQFTGQLSESLVNCTELQFISVGDNSFDGLFPFWLENLADLQVLILRSNNLYGKIQRHSSIISRFHKLRILDISNNNFVGQLPNTFFRNLNAMKSTYFGNSTAMGTTISFNLILDDVSFTLSFNSYSMTLTNKGVKREYERILNVFIAIDLSCNNFTREIPQSLQDLRGIQSLNLSNNHLTGHILQSFGDLKNLESLDLSKNGLLGEIPQRLVQLGFLAIWNVSFNHLDGRIPQGKQFDTFDDSSYLGNYGLCGVPLSKDCQSSKATTPPPTRNQYEDLLPSKSIDWIVIFLGVGSGLTVGIVFGNILYARYSDWFVERFGLRKVRWVKPISNKRRN